MSPGSTQTQSPVKTRHDGQTPERHAALPPLQDDTALDNLIAQLQTICNEMYQFAADVLGRFGEVHESSSESAQNLLHYVALRRHDHRRLQENLAALGLSSLGRAESHVMANVEAVLKILCALGRRPAPSIRSHRLNYWQGISLLEKHTHDLLGAKPARRNVRIMVTLPSEAAGDRQLMRDLLLAGMDCVRINCAHDDETIWAQMIENLRRAEEVLGKRCRVLMDLGGPKLRTGAIESGAQVLKWKPRRDSYGKVIAPARIWLTAAESPVPPPVGADASLPVGAQWLSQLRTNDRITFTDARGAHRALTVIQHVEGGCWADCEKTAYVVPGLELRVGPDDAKRCTKIGALPPLAQPIVLRKGDTLILTQSPAAGRPAIIDEHGRLLSPARVSCTLPEVFADVCAGEKIWIDDGKIGGVIRAVCAEELHIAITHARPTGSKLRADKGINLPESSLRLPALTQQDIANLPFVAAHADIVGLSFAHKASDVHELSARLSDLGGDNLGIILKIETRRGFEQLPNLLLAAMRRPSAGVMIARGDLAVECGYERLAEVQEEILWLCEAAHIPVIWATQVLETLVKTGVPTRSEITDAAMGNRAECVMLNKGPHIVAAVHALDDILHRMQDHQSKKMPMLRPLRMAQNMK